MNGKGEPIVKNFKRIVTLLLCMAVVLGVFSACTDSSGVNNPSVINHDPPSDPGEIYFEDIEEEHIQKTEDGIEYADNIILVTL